MCVCLLLQDLLQSCSRGGTLEEPGTLTQGVPVFPGSSRLGIEPKTPGWLAQDPNPSPSGDLIPTIRGSGAVVFITAVPITKLFASREGDSGGHVLRETTSRGLSGLVCPSRTSERGGWWRTCANERWHRLLRLGGRKLCRGQV